MYFLRITNDGCGWTSKYKSQQTHENENNKQFSYQTHHFRIVYEYIPVFGTIVLISRMVLELTMGADCQAVLLSLPISTAVNTRFFPG